MPSEKRVSLDSGSRAKSSMLLFARILLEHALILKIDFPNKWRLITSEYVSKWKVVASQLEIPKVCVILFPVRAVILLTAICSLSQAQEPNVAFLTLAEENGFNQFDISVGAQGVSDSDDTTLSGTAEIVLNIDPETGTTDSLLIRDARINATDLNFTLSTFFGLVVIAELDARNLKGTAGTPLGVGPVNPGNGEFDASLHTFTLNEGTLTGEALNNPVNNDVSENPITGSGTGTWTVTLSNPVERENRRIFYDVTITLPVGIDDTIPVEEGGIEASVEVAGTLKASGTVFVIRPPTYDEWAVEQGLSEKSQDGFELNARIPNAVLYALGHDDPAPSTRLFIPTAQGLRLNASESGMRSEVTIEYSTDFQNWQPLPTSRLLSASGEIPVLSIGDGLGFYRVSAGE